LGPKFRICAILSGITQSVKLSVQYDISIVSLLLLLAFFAANQFVNFVICFALTNSFLFLICVVHFLYVGC